VEGEEEPHLRPTFRVGSRGDGRGDESAAAEWATGPELGT
jgi:hypothetical protein